ncbi:MAG TPA: DNA starvation/stationary phase protection protein Dps [Chthoniobacteraceae bacterium]|nr:DNA starvation/stationary phase protection protein Dps [Chthoniobacteraceae bacterium]
MSTKTKALPHQTALDLPTDKRTESVRILNQHLANLSDLASQTKQAHWNVRGPEFYQLHKLFDDLVAPLGEHIDTVAERAVTLGGFAMGTVRCAAASSELEEFPLEPGAIEYVKALAKRWAQEANAIREAIDKTADLGDADTADLFTQISRELDKGVWFLEAHFRA